MLPAQLLVARYLDSNIPGTASQVCILLWVEFPWIFPGPGVTNEGWQQLISYQINDRQAFQLLHSPHSLSTSGPSLMFLTGMMEMICMLHSDWHHYTEMVSTRTQQTNKMLACDGWSSPSPCGGLWRMRVLVLLHFSAFFRNFIESRAPGAGVNTLSQYQ